MRRAWIPGLLLTLTLLAPAPAWAQRVMLGGRASFAAVNPPGIQHHGFFVRLEAPAVIGFEGVVGTLHLTPVQPIPALHALVVLTTPELGPIRLGYRTGIGWVPPAPLAGATPHELGLEIVDLERRVVVGLWGGAYVAFQVDLAGPLVIPVFGFSVGAIAHQGSASPRLPGPGQDRVSPDWRPIPGPGPGPWE